MFSRTLTTVVLTALATGVFAGGAQAAIVHHSDIKLTGSGYDFGGSGFAFGAPTGSGDLHFHFENGTIRPHLVGTLHLNNAKGTWARMKLVFRDEDGDDLTEPRYGGTVCADDNRHHKWSVDLNPYTNRRIKTVQVYLQKQTAAGWSTVDTAAGSVLTHWDNVLITEQGFDFGSTMWGLGAPNGYGTMRWELSNGVASPRLIGGIHINNSAGACARMNLRYLTDAGTYIADKPGGTLCAADNGHHVWSVDLAPAGSNMLGKVQVQLQTLAANGQYITAGSQTVSIAQ